MIPRDFPFDYCKHARVFIFFLSHLLSKHIIHSFTADYEVNESRTLLSSIDDMESMQLRVANGRRKHSLDDDDEGSTMGNLSLFA